MKNPDQVAKDEILAVGRKNKEVMVGMNWELNERLLETLEVMNASELMNEKKEGEISNLPRINLLITSAQLPE